MNICLFPQGTLLLYRDSWRQFYVWTSIDMTWLMLLRCRHVCTYAFWNYVTIKPIEFSWWRSSRFFSPGDISLSHYVRSIHTRSLHWYCCAKVTKFCFLNSRNYRNHSYFHDHTREFFSLLRSSGLQVELKNASRAVLVAGRSLARTWPRTVRLPRRPDWCS